MNVWKKIIFSIIELLVRVIVGAFLGVVIGAFIGGNFMTDFQFNGVQGYEATGQIGILLGFLIGIIMGVRKALKTLRGNA